MCFVSIESFVYRIYRACFDILQEDIASSSRGKRGSDGKTGGSRAKSSKKDLTPNDVEDAIRNGRVILFPFTLTVYLVVQINSEIVLIITDECCHCGTPQRIHSQPKSTYSVEGQQEGSV